MTSSNTDAFGNEFLPGKDREPKDVTMRAMKNRFGGLVAKPFNRAISSWDDGFTEHDAPRERQ